MYTIIAYLSSSSNPKDYKCKKGQERREYFYSGECSFVVHLNENLCNESFSWSFERKNLCRPCYEGQRLVEVCLSLVAGKVRLSVTLLWLKFLVLNSFPCFAGFFDHPPLNTREHDRLKHETKDSNISNNNSNITIFFLTSYNTTLTSYNTVILQYSDSFFFEYQGTRSP